MVMLIRNYATNYEDIHINGNPLKIWIALPPLTSCTIIPELVPESIVDGRATTLNLIKYINGARTVVRDHEKIYFIFVILINSKRCILKGCQHKKPY